MPKFSEVLATLGGEGKDLLQTAAKTKAYDDPLPAEDNTYTVKFLNPQVRQQQVKDGKSVTIVSLPFQTTYPEGDPENPSRIFKWDIWLGKTKKGTRPGLKSLKQLQKGYLGSDVAPVEDGQTSEEAESAYIDLLLETLPEMHGKLQIKTSEGTKEDGTAYRNVNFKGVVATGEGD